MYLSKSLVYLKGRISLIKCLYAKTSVGFASGLDLIMPKLWHHLIGTNQGAKHGSLREYSVISLTTTMTWHYYNQSSKSCTEPDAQWIPSTARLPTSLDR